jgi:hypothetical protein
MAISEEEVASRIVLLKRFRALLLQQREHFEFYLAVLDKQMGEIGTGSVEDLIAHVELEEKIIGDILAIQKVIEPMRAIVPAAAFAAGSDVGRIASTVETLRMEAVSRVTRNKNLLQSRMEDIRADLNALRVNPFARRQSPFASTDAPSFIDIKG